MKKNFIVTENENGKTVKEYVRNTLGYSASTLRNMKYNGKISVDGKEVYTNFVLKPGMTLTLETKDEPSDAAPENIPLEVIYEDEDFIAVNKPSGMPVHPSHRHRTGTLSNALTYYFKDMPFTVRVLTRLDADTTGIVLVAKNIAAAGTFDHSKAAKKYLALCVGVPKENDGIIDAPITRDEGIIKRKVSPDGKKAVTKYKVLETHGNLSLVEAEPVTGRTHQIRLHLSHIGCPLYGDFLYGEEVKDERCRLHCGKISFFHPFYLKDITLFAPVPKDFEIAEKK